MEKLSKNLETISGRMQELEPIVKSIELGWFARLKVDKKGFVTNLPEGNENIVYDFLIKQKEKLGAKGKIEEANKLVGQMKALEEYLKLLTEREKLLSLSGQA